MHLVIVATADRGLCGGFNTNIVRLARGSRSRRCMRDGKEVKILTVGRKGRDQLRRQYGTHDRGQRSSFTASSRSASPMPRASRARCSTCTTAGEFDVATLDLFALQIGDHPGSDRAAADSRADGRSRGRWRPARVYEYEPDEAEILAELLPRNISVQIFRALLENVAGEFGAQMSAMDTATRNAGDVIDKLTIQMQPYAPGEDHQGTD